MYKLPAYNNANTLYALTPNESVLIVPQLYSGHHKVLVDTLKCKCYIHMGVGAINPHNRVYRPEIK